MIDSDDGSEPTHAESETDDVQRLNLTSAQVEAIHRTMLGIERSLASEIERWRTFKLPESTLKSLAAMSSIANTQRALATNALKPMVDVQSVWRKQIDSISTGLISSDVFKKLALVQSNINLVASQLTTNFDFGAIAAAQEFVASQATWLEHLGPTLSAMRRSFYPRNLRAVEGLKFEEVEQVVMVDGIPLYGLPRPSTAEALIRAVGASERRDILGRRWKSISADCRTTVQGCTSGAVVAYSTVAVAALDALEAGHTAAAQALAGSLVDAVVNSYFGKNRYKYTPSKSGARTSDAYDAFNVRQFIAFAPMWQTYQKFFVDEGDKVPTTFSRNATAHTVSPRQFNRRNAVQGLMFACSLLYRLDEESRVREDVEPA